MTVLRLPVAVFLMFLVVPDIMAQSTDLPKTMYVNATAGLRVRNSPDVNADRIGVLSDLSEVTVIREDRENLTIDGINGKWTFIESSIVSGWVFGGYLSQEPMRRAKLEDIQDTISFFEEYFNFEKLNPARGKTIEEFIEIFGAIGDTRTINHQRKDVGGWGGEPSPYYIDAYTIEYGFYWLDVWYGSMLIGLEITLDESNFANLFPYRTLEEYLTDGGFGLETRITGDGLTALYRYAEDGWNLIFKNGLLYQIAFHRFLP